MKTDKKERVFREILDFHVHIKDWFQGNTADKDSLFADLVSNFHPQFAMEGPSGRTMELAAFKAWLPTAFGMFLDREIYITELQAHLTDRHALASYVETQTTNGETTVRKSSAVFILHEDSVAWYHLLEDWTAG